jgi:uncharacterized membrane protein
MKKMLIGSLVGAIILFGWQAISWTVSGIHDKALQYVPNQDAIIQSLSGQLPADGQYMVPRSNPQATSEEQMKYSEGMTGKPWAVISYHSTFKNNMGLAMIRGFLISFVSVLLVCLVIRRFDQAYKNFLSIFTSVLTFGVICFIYVWYSQHNWFQTSWDVLWGELIDLFASWGLCGLWLAWWYTRKLSRY